MTLLDIKNNFYEELKISYPKKEIENLFFILTEEFLQMKRIDIALDPNKNIDDTVTKRFISALSRLKMEEPVQYIIGGTHFYGLPFKVNSSVLIPRPETEELVEWVIQEGKSRKSKVESRKLNPPAIPIGKKSVVAGIERESDLKLNILDIGTGSGCIAVSLAKNLPNAEVWAMDISDKALKTAIQNAKQNNVTVHFINENILSLKTLSQKSDIIVSNPPYVRIQEKNQMKNNVLKYEPEIALFVEDDDPLLFYRKITDFAKNNLNDNGSLFFEINQYLAKDTVSLLKKNGFTSIELKKDIFGNDRMIRAKLNHRMNSPGE